jgi:hypothetical protein
MAELWISERISHLKHLNRIYDFECEIHKRIREFRFPSEPVSMNSFDTIYGNVMQWISYPVALEYFSRFQMEGKGGIGVSRIKSKQWTQLRPEFSRCYRVRKPRWLWETSIKQLPTDVFRFPECQDLGSVQTFYFEGMSKVTASLSVVSVSHYTWN